MGMPSISISFTETGSTAISRGERGIIAMILKDAIPAKNPVVCKTESDVPVSLSEASKEQIALAFKGYEYSPLLVMIYVIAADAKDYSAALNYFKTVKFDYLVAPSAETDKQTTAIVNYVKSERGSGKLIKAVLPNTTADCEGIVNFATEKVIAGSKTYTTEGMSGLLAIVNSSDGDFEKLSNSIYDADGACKKMYDTAQDNLQGQLTILKSTLESIGISLGERMTPYVKNATEWLQKLAEKFNSLSDKQKDMIIKIALAAAAMGVDNGAVYERGNAGQRFQGISNGKFTGAG